jgi:hypothetical protein
LGLLDQLDLLDDADGQNALAQMLAFMKQRTEG